MLGRRRHDRQRHWPGAALPGTASRPMAPAGRRPVIRPLCLRRDTALRFMGAVPVPHDHAR